MGNSTRIKEIDMDRDQAYQVLKNAMMSLKLSYQDHNVLQQALAVLYGPQKPLAVPPKKTDVKESDHLGS